MHIDLLGLFRIAPSAFHYRIGLHKRRAVIYSYPKFDWLFRILHWWDMNIANPLRMPALNFGFDTYSEQPSAGIDARVRDDSATTNFGTDANLYVGEYEGFSEVHRTWIKFDLSSIDDDQEATSGTLSLWMHSEASANARTLRIYRSIRAWVESQVTWNIYSTSNNWSTAGGFDASDVDTTDMGSLVFSASESNGEKQFSFTDLDKLSAMLPNNGWTNNGWLIKADTEVDDWYAFRSSDYATASERPKLVIEYEAVSGGERGTMRGVLRGVGRGI